MYKKFMVFLKKSETLIAIAIIIYVSIFFALNVARYHALFSFEWQDEATENQIAWNTAHGDIFYQSIFDGVFFGHVTPFHLIIASFYLIFPHIFMWYFLSALGVALSSVIVYKLALLFLNDKKLSFFIAISYLLYPPLHYLCLGPIDTIIFFIPLFFLSFYFFVKGRFACFLFSMILAMSCKESAPVIFIAFSFFAFFTGKSRRWVIVPLIIAITWFIAATWFILPGVSTAEYNLDAKNLEFYSLDRHSAWSLLKFIINSPIQFIIFLFSREKIWMLCNLLLPVIFLPVLSSATLIGIAGFLQILLVNGPFKNQNSYYIANVVPFIFIGYIYGLRRIDLILVKFRIKDSRIKLINYCIIFLSMTISISYAFGGNILGKPRTESIHDFRFLDAKNIFDPVFYKMDDEDKIAWSMIKLIPKTASVAATGDLLIPLSHRRKILEFGNTEPGYDYFDVEYLLINKKNMSHGGGEYSHITKEDIKRIEFLVDEGKLKVIKQREPFILLKKTSRIKERIGA